MASHLNTHKRQTSDVELHTLQEWIECISQPLEAFTTTKLYHQLRLRYARSVWGGTDSPTISKEDEEILLERTQVYKEMLTSLVQPSPFSSSSPTSSSSHLPSSSSSFSLTSPISLVASPGRDRLFLGHSDLGGLGGFTLDCATREEVLCIAQRTDDGMVHIMNSEPVQFPPYSFPLASILPIANDPTKFGERCFDPTSWHGYVQAAICYMMCQRFDKCREVRECLGLTHSSAPDSIMTSPWNSPSTSSPLISVGLRFFVSSPGLLKLSHAGGISSSAALTGAISMSLCQLFPRLRQLVNLSHLAQIDFGEYFLGKLAGSADKMAQLYAHAGCVTVITSQPEVLRRVVRFPSNEISLLIATAPIPRLTMAGLSRPFMKERGYTSQHIERVIEWATETMASFSSTAYIVAVEMMMKALDRPERYERVGLTSEEAKSLKTALVTHEAVVFEGADGDDQVPLPKPTSSVSPISLSPLSQRSPSPSTGLLRELCHGGAIETLLPPVRGWEKRHRRYKLIYQLLKLIPERYVHVISSSSSPGKTILLYLRKAALYGLAELERGHEYLRCLDGIRRIRREMQSTPMDSNPHPSSSSVSLSSISPSIDSYVNRILHLTALCHDGDRACVDYRRLRDATSVPSVEEYLAAGDDVVYADGAHNLPPPKCTRRWFEETPWMKDSRNDVSDAKIDEWIESCQEWDSTADSNPIQSQQLADLSGGFERGLIDIDEMADRVHQRYANQSIHAHPHTLSPFSSLSLPFHASLRISAAGLGGRVCIHARPHVVDDLSTFLQTQGWDIRHPTPAPPTQTINLD